MPPTGKRDGAMRMNGKTSYLALLAVGGLILSLSGVAVAFSSMGTSAMGFYRMLLGGLGLAGFALWRGLRWRMTRQALLYACLAGAALALDLYWWHKSIRMVGPGLGAILTNCQSFFLAGLAWAVFRERITVVYFVALVLAATGILMVSGAGLPVASGPDSASEHWLGVALGLASAAAYALCVVFIKKGQTPPHATHPAVNMAVLCAAAAPCLLAAAWLEGESLAIAGAADFGTLLLYGLLVQGVAWLMVSTAVPHVKASLAGLILLAEPIGTYAIDVLFFTARPTPMALAGMVLTLAAIYAGSTYGGAPSGGAPSGGAPARRMAKAQGSGH